MYVLNDVIRTAYCGWAGYMNSALTETHQPWVAVQKHSDDVHVYMHVLACCVLHLCITLLKCYVIGWYKPKRAMQQSTSL